MRRIEHLYHLAEAANLPSILKHGLLSTERLLELAGMSKSARKEFVWRHRPANVTVAEGITVRDQRPMPPTALASALDDGLEPGDWYALLNSFVFLWPNQERMERQRSACGDRPQAVLTFDAQALFDQFGDRAFLSPINSGNARRRPARRGRDTLMPYAAWAELGWPNRVRSHAPAEVLFACPIPAQKPYLISIDRD